MPVLESQSARSRELRDAQEIDHRLNKLPARRAKAGFDAGAPQDLSWKLVALYQLNVAEFHSICCSTICMFSSAERRRAIALEVEAMLP
jgi:hypothetical protein